MASSTPNRRSIYDLEKSFDEIFASVASSSGSNETGEQTIPLEQLPQLIRSYQRTRNTLLFGEEDMAAIDQMSHAQPEFRCTRDDIYPLLGALGTQYSGAGNEGDANARRQRGATELGSPIPRSKRSRRPSLLQEDTDDDKDSKDEDVTFRLSNTNSDSDKESDTDQEDAGDDRPASPFSASSSSLQEKDGARIRSGSKTSLEGGGTPSGLPRATNSSAFANRQRSSPLIAPDSAAKDGGRGTPSPSPAVGAGSAQSRSAKAGRASYDRPTTSSRQHALQRPAAPGARKAGAKERNARAGSEPLSPTESNFASSSADSKSGGGSRAQSPTSEITDPAQPGGRRKSAAHAHSSSDGRSRGHSSASESGTRGNHAHSQSGPPRSGSQVDLTSFHATPTSPSADENDANFYPSFPSLSDDVSSLRRSDSARSHTSSTSSRPGSMFFGEGFGAGGSGGLMGMRPESTLFNPVSGSPIPSGSGTPSRPGSMAGPEAQIQVMQKQLAESQRKIQGLQHILDSERVENERSISEHQERIEEMKAELAAYKKEKKELHAKETFYENQIKGFEDDISRATKNLERQKESHSNIKKQYDEQCYQAEKLRNLIREKDQDLRDAKESLHSHTVEADKWSQDRVIVEETMTKLQHDLNESRKSQEAFDELRTENSVLKETIDRLHFDLDELRMNNRLSLIGRDGSSRGDSAANSIAGSMSKTLGRELARRLAEDGDEEEDDGDVTEGEDDSTRRLLRQSGSSDDFYEQTIVTTVKRKKRPNAAVEGPTEEPVVERIEEVKEVADVSTQVGDDLVQVNEVALQTDEAEPRTVTVQAPPEPTKEALVQTEKEGLLGLKMGVGSRLIQVQAGPKGLQQALARELGLSADVVDEALRAANEVAAAETAEHQDRADPSPDGSVAMAELFKRIRSRGERWHSRFHLPPSAAPYASTIINILPPSTQSALLSFLNRPDSSVYLGCLVVYLAGIITGMWSSNQPLPSSGGLSPFDGMGGSGLDTGLWRHYNEIKEMTDRSGMASVGLGQGTWYFISRTLFSAADSFRRNPS